MNELFVDEVLIVQDSLSMVNKVSSWSINEPLLSLISEFISESEVDEFIVFGVRVSEPDLMLLEFFEVLFGFSWS
jgi:hypothetical protein